jgi:hypothetical protein
VSPRLRILTLVWVAAAAAAAVVIGATVLQSQKSSASDLPEGNPPLVLDFGLRQDVEARDLERGLRLYQEGNTEAAARVFARYRSADARIGHAVAGWPSGTLQRLEQLAAEQPGNGVVRLNLGFALFWSGRKEDAVAAWRQTRVVAPDSLAAVRAGDLLFPQFASGLPVFTPDRPEGAVGRRPSPAFASSGSAGSSPRAGSTTRRSSWRPTIRRRTSPPPSGASTRRIRPPRSRGSARSRGAFRARRPSVSTWVCYFFGSAGSTRRRLSC